MSGPVLPPQIPVSHLHQETFTIPKQPTTQDAMKLMDLVSRFLTKLAVELLSEEKGDKPLFPASHPAPVALLQAAATLQNGHAQLEMIAAQHTNFVGPQGPQGGPQRFRTN